MATLAQADLSAAERELLDRFVALLVAEFDERLAAVWLYGSLARGKRVVWESDIDVMVIVDELAEGEWDRVRELAREASEGIPEEPDRLSPEFAMSPWAYGLDGLAWRREVDDFFVGEVDRDKVVLYGSPLDEVGRDRCPGEEGGAPWASGLFDADGVLRVGGTGMKVRSKEFLVDARRELEDARKIAGLEGVKNMLVVGAYTAMLNAARAAISEADRHSRRHGGVWHAFSEVYVKTGQFDRALYARAAGAQAKRESAIYGRSEAERARGLPRRITPEEAAEVLAAAEAFIPTVEELLSEEG